MSLLTKIFVVLMAIFSIAFTMTTVNFVAKTNGWQDLAKKYRTELQVVETHMRNQAAAHATEKTAWVDARKDLQSRIAMLETEKSQQLADVAGLNQQITELKSDKGSWETQANQCQIQLQFEQQSSDAERKQRKELEKRNMELERRNLDLSERVNEQTAQILVLVQQQNQLEQQINILREENRRVSRGGGLAPVRGESTTMITDALGQVRPQAPPAVTPIRGRILQVDGNIATVSVGSADGVQEGLVFVIYRGEQYVGDLKITDVQPNIAAGRVVRPNTTPRPNDMVSDEPSFGLAK